jgi:peptidoglycan glycosyltransferase
MASFPTYDPNLVEGHFNRVTNVRADCKRPDALLNRATAGLYAPGSTFKVVTASAAIDSGRFTPTSSFVDPGYCEVYGKRVNNYDTTSPFGRLDLATALKYSVNSVFCNIGKELGAKKLVDYAKRRSTPSRRSRRRRTNVLRAASTRGPSSSTRRRTPTSIRVGSRSARSGCS